MPRLSRFTVSILLCFANGAAAPAQVVPPDTLPAEPASEEPGFFREVEGSIRNLWRWSDAQMRDIFDVFLPDTQERRTWRLTLEPRFGDLFNNDYVRTPVGFVYGLNTRADGTIELDTYLPNIFRDGAGSGIANTRAGFKYSWQPRIFNMKAAAFGFQAVIPVDNSPPELNDGVNRCSFFVTLARPSTRTKDIEYFLGLSYDLITPSSAGGYIATNKPQDDFFKIAPGVLYKRKDATYGLTVAWERTVDGPTQDFFTVTPSVIFKIPERYTFNSPGVWQLGSALETKFYDGRTEFSFRVRVRWLVNFRTAWGDWRENRRVAREAKAERLDAGSPPAGEGAPAQGD